VDLCAEADLVRRKGDRLLITPVGRACAAKGIGAKTGIVLAQWAREATTTALSELELLTVASFTETADDVYVGLTKEERYRANYRSLLLARAEAQGVAARPIFAGIASEPNAAEYEAVKAMKKTLLLVDWIDEMPVKELESRYSVWAGGIRRIGEEYGWVVDALAALALACGWPDERAAVVRALADRLTYGVRNDAVEIARIRARGVGRAYMRKLVDAGLLNKAFSAALWSALGRKKGRAAHSEPSDAGASRAADGNPTVAVATTMAIPERPSRLAEPVALLTAAPVPLVQPDTPTASPVARTSMAASTAPSVDALAPPLLTVDLAERRVVYRGVEIPTRPPRNIQRQPLLALFVLAEHAGQTITVSDLADEMRRVGHLARRLVAPEPRDLRYKLLVPFRHALKSTVSAAEIDRLVESVSRDGLRLNVPGTVSVVAGNMDSRGR
jgi:hypothetical protein